MHYRLARRDFSWRDHSRVKAFSEVPIAPIVPTLSVNPSAHTRDIIFMRGICERAERDEGRSYDGSDDRLTAKWMRTWFFVANARVEEIKCVSRVKLRNRSWKDARSSFCRNDDIFRSSVRAFKRTTMRVYHTWLLDLSRLCAENIINWEFNATPLDIYAQIE